MQVQVMQQAVSCGWSFLIRKRHAALLSFAFGSEGGHPVSSLDPSLRHVLAISGVDVFVTAIHGIWQARAHKQFHNTTSRAKVCLEFMHVALSVRINSFVYELKYELHK